MSKLDQRRISQSRNVSGSTKEGTEHLTKKLLRASSHIRSIHEHACRISTFHQFFRPDHQIPDPHTEPVFRVAVEQFHIILKSINIEEIGETEELFAEDEEINHWLQIGGNTCDSASLHSRVLKSAANYLKDAALARVTFDLALALHHDMHTHLQCAIARGITNPYSWEKDGRTSTNLTRELIDAIFYVQNNPHQESAAPMSADFANNDLLVIYQYLVTNGPATEKEIVNAIGDQLEACKTVGALRSGRLASLIKMQLIANDRDSNGYYALE